tara:strand:- start:108 stop:317 length:210 start_codon:yes stop_codon:yes gene_type:complete
MTYVKVKDSPDLVRDLRTGAILNVNDEMILKARERKRKKKQDQEELVKMKSDITEIKDLLSSLINKIGD